MQHATEFPDGTGGSAEESQQRPSRRRRVVIGSTTLACAVSGALAGALALSFTGGAPGAGRQGGRLANGTAQVPGDSGALCSSTRNTPTAADTALSCEAYGTASYLAAMARVERREILLIEAATGSGTRAPGTSPASPMRSGSTGTVSGPGGGGATGLPSGGGTSHHSTCVSKAAPAGTPSVGSVSVSASGGGGTVTVTASSHGVKVCGKAPTAPKFPATTAPSSSTVTSTTDKTVTQATTDVTTTIENATNSVGGL